MRLHDIVVLRVRRTLPDHDQTIGFRKSQRPQEHRIDHAENCRRGADSQGERRERQRSKRRILPEHARSIADILRGAGQSAPAPSFAGVLFGARDIAEIAGCAGPRGVLGMAAIRPQSRFLLQVKANFLIELAVFPLALPEPFRPTHFHFSCGRNTRAMASTMRFHFDSSAASFFLPLVVRR